MAVHKFGDFELDEEARVLRLSGAEIALQPRVFELLSYLVAHRSRVIGKDELLDAIWPGVTVTEASLQRAVSLARSALRQGGMEAAVRSFPRYGYRFCPDLPNAGAEVAYAATAASAGSMLPADGSEIERARLLFTQKRWPEALAAFAAAQEADQLGAEDLQRWAMAIECAGRPSDAIGPLTQAVAGFGMSGNPRGAAKAALDLSRIHFERYEMAVARGWHQRAAHLVEAEEPSRESGLLAWTRSRLAVAEGEPERALTLAAQAYGIGQAVEDPAIEALGLMFRGFVELCLGETARGIEDQDHAAALGLSSNVDPIVGSLIYCNILWAARNFGDWERANQWTLGYQRWCEVSGVFNYTGACKLHRAEVLGIRGTLKEAEAMVRSAIENLAVDAPWAIGDGYRVLGDIKFAAGDLPAAEAAYQQAYAIGWDPQPGFAMLRLERHEGEAAYLDLERSLVGRGWPTLQRQGLLLASLAKVAARTGRNERALEIITQLEAQPRRWPMPSIKSLTAEAKAELLIREGRNAEAARQFQVASALWNEVASAINAAEARLSLAALLIELGDFAGADMELTAVRQTAAKVDSPRLHRRSDELGLAVAASRTKTVAAVTP